MVPPETPGIMFAVPMATPLRNRLKYSFIREEWKIYRFG
jgi:hypothetical protein